MGELAAFMGRVVALVGSIESLIVGIAWIVGLVAAISGVRALSAAASAGPGGGRQRSVGVVLLIGSAIMLSLPAFVEMASSTLYGVDRNQSTDIFAHAPQMLEVVGNDHAKTILNGCLRLVQLIGAIGIFKAINLLMRAPYHPGMGLYGRASTHLVAGTLAWNVFLFSGSLEALFLGGTT